MLESRKAERNAVPWQPTFFREDGAYNDSALSDIITLYTPSRGLCSSSDTRLLSIHRPITKSFYGQRTFAYQAPHVWNKLPFEWRHKSMTSAFKSLKTHILHKNESDSTNTLYVFESRVIFCI